MIETPLMARPIHPYADSFYPKGEGIPTLPADIVFLTMSGSLLYGYHSPTRDIDLRGCYLTPLSALIGLEKPSPHVESRTTNTQTKTITDFVAYDVEKLIRLLLERNGGILEAILSPLVVASSSTHAELCDLAPQTLTKYSHKYYLNYALKEQKALEKKETQEQHGLKYVLSIYRLLLTGYFLIRTGRLLCDLAYLAYLEKIPAIQELIQRRQEGTEVGITDEEWKTHRVWFHRVQSLIENTWLTTKLPEQVNPLVIQALDSLLKRERLRTYCPSGEKLWVL